MGKIYTVRRAEDSDLTKILELYRNARKFMRQRGNPDQWGTDRPLRSQTEADLAEGHLYVICNDGIHGVFALIPGDDPTYHEIHGGTWGSALSYCAIHRVAGDGSGGIFAAAAEFSGRICPYLRVDTHENNLPMQRAVERAGFVRRGVIYLEDGSPRIAYDRI